MPTARDGVLYYYGITLSIVDRGWDYSTFGAGKYQVECTGV